eukprot:CAMPEP_0173193416 /NCGR_PEP_ID=MMETSP1141-20130122/13943_1 /TAXON_ID=483371 /ORGANISM="non described non described, Strain CCMP2298" /LENGTH=512 /DNA_ID=CAMNT_0014117743 /DNA_START=89 /DNA_END=1624 /DNA_ORIENTATION=+
MTGLLQLKGCLNRVYIEKRRNARVTCCEFCSHLILVLILVAGYSLSQVETYAAKIYTEVYLAIPPFQDGALTAGLDILSGPLIVPTLDQFIAANEFLSANEATSGIGGLLTQTSFGRTFTNLLYKGGLHFAPRGEQVDSLISYMNSTYTRFSDLNVYVHDSEDEGVQFILDGVLLPPTRVPRKNNPNKTRILKNSEDRYEPALALIVLKEVTPEKVNYLIRQNYTTLPNTNEVTLRSVLGLDTQYQSYLISGFLTLQKAVDQWAFNYTQAVYGDSRPDAPTQCTGPPQAVLIPFPTPAYDQNPFYAQVGFLLGLAIVMSTMYPMSRLTKSVVEEKELRMREVMKIMGLREWVHQATWFISAFVLFFWIAVTTTLITKASFLLRSDPALLFAYFFLFAMSEINFAFLVSVFFSNSKLAAIVAPVVLFGSILPRFAFLNTNNNEAVASKTLASLLSPTAFAFGSDIIAQYEYGGTGVQFYNMYEGGFNFGTVLSMMLLDFFLYGIMAWYLDQVI